MDMKQPRMKQETGAAAETAALVPAVDVFEDENGITLEADLPGVSKESLAIRVDADTLTIEGTVELGEAEKLEAIYAEVRVNRYRRSFVLSRDLDTASIDATMKNGVLRLRVPKHERVKPRRIAVRVD